MFGISLIPLPYRIGIFAVMLAGTYGLGRYQGSSNTQKAWDLQSAKDQAGIADILVENQKRANESSQAIADKLSLTRAAIAANNVKLKSAIDEVTRVLQANPYFSDVVVPDDIMRLRAADVAESAAAASTARENSEK